MCSTKTQSLPKVCERVIYRAPRYAYTTNLEPDAELEYDDLAALICRVCAGLENVVNLQVFFDGPEQPKWITMVRKGDKVGQWRWPD